MGYLDYTGGGPGDTVQKWNVPVEKKHNPRKSLMARVHTCRWCLAWRVVSVSSHWENAEVALVVFNPVTGPGGGCFKLQLSATPWVSFSMVSITNCHKCSGLKQYKFILQFGWSKV